MRRITFLCFIILLRLNVAGQDQLFRTDNTKILVKVIEVGTDYVKYKLFEDPNGPMRIEEKNNVALIIFQNGQHQVFTQQSRERNPSAGTATRGKRNLPFSEEDSAGFIRHVNNVSMNFLYVFNNEIGLMYRREFYYNSFNLVIPLAVGISTPAMTQEVYFNTNPVRINLDRKLFEIGVGMNYYASLRTRNNLYIGPMVRYMQYDVNQVANSYPAYTIAYNETVLARYAFSLTTGFIFRTRSRLSTELFFSVGFKRDKIRDPLVDPGGLPVTTLPEPTAIYYWSGFLVGYSF